MCTACWMFCSFIKVAKYNPQKRCLNCIRSDYWEIIHSDIFINTGHVSFFLIFVNRGISNHLMSYILQVWYHNDATYQGTVSLSGINLFYSITGKECISKKYIWYLGKVRIICDILTCWHVRSSCTAKEGFGK